MSECDAGYKLDGNACTPWGGQCANGTPRAQSERTADDQCRSCDAGYTLAGDKCNSCGAANAKSYSGGCTVSECDAGYRIIMGACEPWGGTCAGGTLKAQADRRASDQCGSCDSGHELIGDVCGQCGIAHVKSYADGCAVSECNAGYELDGNTCKPWSGNLSLIHISEPTRPY